jgi:hypothetical protein
VAFFSQAASPTLYLGQVVSGDVGTVAYILPTGVTFGKDLELKQALEDQGLAGSFIFALSPMDFSGDKARQDKFVEGVQTIVARSPASRDIIWIADPTAVADDTVDPRSVPCLGLAPDGSSVASGLNAQLTLSLSITISSSMSLTLDGTDLALSSSQSQYSIDFSGTSAPTMSLVLNGTLSFSGPSRGCILFGTFFQHQSLNDAWGWGFNFTFGQSSSSGGMISEWLPLADPSGPPSTDMLGFNASVDPLDPFNRVNPMRTAFGFTGSNQNGAVTSLASYYRTTIGAPVTLTPAGVAGPGIETAALVFAKGQNFSDTQDSFHASPVGDFVMQAALGPDGRTADLLCGLQGTEFLVFTPGADPTTGSRLRFQPGKPAFVGQFPPPLASPVGPPTDPTALPLDMTLVTSWATVVPPVTSSGTIAYVAQPKGFSLYGYDTFIAPSYKSMLGAVEPGLTLPTAFFPMPCYAGVRPGDGVGTFCADQIARFETLILGPTRRALIERAKAVPAASARAATLGTPNPTPTPTPAPISTTTPSGIIAQLDSTTGVWSQILLGQTVTPAATTMAFNKPSSNLQNAFQTNQLFLVVANAVDLVRPDGKFLNQLNIGNWVIEANVGQSPGYNDYANILIVKGIKGPLFDPKGDPKQNLVSNPEKWTQAGTFAKPTVGDEPPDQAQLVILSQWLQSYFTDAAKQTDVDFFSPFNTLAADPNWTGILVLRAKIAEPPKDIAGIRAGVKDKTRFYAHHLSIAISQISYDNNKKSIGIDQQSSIYGLIYYIDPTFDPTKPDQPVPPDPGQDYDFRVLTLKVQFENTAVKRFASLTQLTLNRVFGSTVISVSGTGQRYNSILLTGSFQNNNGIPAYSLGTKGDFAFLFDSNIYNKIEITSAQLTTKSADGSRVASVFSLAGFIDFKALGTGSSTTSSSGSLPVTAGDPPPPPLSVDLLSFGSPADSQAPGTPRTGLAFSNLTINMAFDTANPAARTLMFDAGAIAFNLQASTPRQGSLFTSLALELQGLSQGMTADDAPAKQGYLNVITDVRLGGLGNEWTGLRFRLNLGTPGALAGAAGLNATLLLAWSPDTSGTSYRALAGVQMPGASSGAKLISLQTVLSLSYGVIQLLYAPKPSGTGRQFMLVLNEIAIKFLSLLKIPPSGNSAFYLFGDADYGHSGDQSGLGWYAVYNNEPKSNPPQPIAGPTSAP